MTEAQQRALETALDVLASLGGVYPACYDATKALREAFGAKPFVETSTEAVIRVLSSEAPDA